MVEEYRFGEHGDKRTDIKRPGIKIFGIGGAGRNILSSLLDEPSLSNVDFYEIGERARLEGIPFIRTDKEKNKGIWGPRLERGRDERLRGIETFKNRIMDITTRADMVFLLSGLGGDTGSYTTPICSHIIQQTGAFTGSFVTMPFDMEGEERTRVAEGALEDLMEQDDITAVFENDKLLNKYPQIPMTKAFDVMNEVISLPLKDINSVLTRKDLPKLKEFTAETDRFKIGGGYGKGRKKGKRAVRETFNSPWLDDEDGYRTIISFIRKGTEPGRFENDDVLSEIKNRSPGSDIIWGTIKDNSIGERTRVNILAGF